MKVVPKTKQSGVMLFEAMIAVLIFSMGVLALVALQATSIKLSADAKYRAVAAMMTDQLFSEMWVSGSSASALQTDFQSPDGTKYSAWKARVAKAFDKPADFDFAGSPPEVVVSGNPAIVTIVLQWPDKNSTSEALRKHTARAQIVATAQ